MADVTITPVAQVVNTRSADLIGAGSVVNATQTFEIVAKGETRNLIIILEELNTGAATVTFDAGVNPPSMLGSRDGDLAISLAQADIRYLPLEPGQFVQADGTITGTVTGNNCRIYVMRDPREK